MRYLSVCSGIEAATAAWHPLGWSPVAFSEIEAFPCRVLRHHYPHVPNWGDMTKFKDWPDATVDLLVGGTPCQSFSIAGLRNGLADPRGNLMLTYGAIAAKYRPRWLVWENVPGVLSSNHGQDFGTFLGMLGQLGYGFAYRVLDAQYFGVAQRRRRVFVVGYLGDWRRAAAVLLEPESMRGDPAPSRETRQDLTGALGTGASKRAGWRAGADEAAAGQIVAHPLLAKHNASHRADSDTYVTARAYGGNNTSGAIDVTPALLAQPGSGYKGDFDSETFIVGALNANGKAAGSATQQDAESGLLIPVAFDCKAGGNTGFAVGDVPGALRGVGHGGGHAAVVNPQPGNACHPIAAHGHAPAVCGSGVRRLTPRECERLQGFPDDYTLISAATKDGPRYKAIGNSMAVPVMAWIGRRIAFVDTIRQAA